MGMLCWYILLLLFGVAVATGDLEVEFAEAREGSDAELPCNLQPVHPPDKVNLVAWHKGSDETVLYKYDMRGSRGQHWADPSVGDRYFLRMLDGERALLTISLTRLSDEAVYHCRVDFNRSPTRYTQVNLTVIDLILPSVIGPSRQDIANESEDDDDSIADPMYHPESPDRSYEHLESDSGEKATERPRPSEHSEGTERPQPSENSEIYTGRPKKGRKRKYKDQNRAGKKKNRNSNLPYYNYKGVKVNPKEFHDFECRCPLKCSQIVSTEKRKLAFDRFWSLQSYDCQTNFIAATVSEFPKKRVYGRNTQKRTFSRIYAIDTKRVCRNMYIKTLGITTFRVNTAVKKFHGRTDALTDQRGIAQGGKNKLPEATIQRIVDQINKIPRYTSHYCRTKTEANFLPPGMTIQKMYELYCSEEDKPVSLAYYKKVFYGKFNLRMKPIKKDTCNTCDSLKNQIDNERDLEKKEQLQTTYKKHLDLAEQAQKMRREDFERANKSQNFECLTFDLEKTLPLPRIPTNIVFYKRQLWVYNCGVHSGKEGRGYCYVWVEGEAGRGAQEVGSCLLKHIRTHLPPAVRHLSLWSDACGGQNRNIKLTLFLKSILMQSPTLESITMNFLVSGHSFLPNDSDFSDIECALKSQQRLYTPDDYMEIMRSCRKKKPLRVTKMISADFVSIANPLGHIVNRKEDTHKNKINWLHIRSIFLHKNEPYSLAVKQNEFTSPHQNIDIKRKSVRVRPSTTSFADLTPLWPEGKPIGEKKLQNLQEMLHLIPADALEFYTNLRSDSSIVEDVDGFDVETLDFDPEEQE